MKQEVFQLAFDNLDLRNMPLNDFPETSFVNQDGYKVKEGYVSNNIYRPMFFPIYDTCTCISIVVDKAFKPN